MRLDQEAFRILVTDNYHRMCAVTRERTLPALEAAHIRPFAEGGEHEASNGVLLRRDVLEPVRRRLRHDHADGQLRGQPPHQEGVRERAAVLRTARAYDRGS
jgi:hypothetical protein